MNQRTIVVGCPVRERAWILPRYLEALGRLVAPAGRQLLFHFVVQPSRDRTEEIIAAWCAARPNASWGEVRGAPAGWRRDAGPGRYNIAWLAAVRNVLADQALRAGADLLSVDSDVIVPPDLLIRLEALGQDIAAALISNTPGAAVGGPQAAVNARPLVDTPAAWAGMLAGLSRAEWTGACCLYRHEVFAAGVRWGPHPSGEDVAFCRQALWKGFGCWVDGRIRAEHVMQETRHEPLTT